MSQAILDGYIPYRDFFLADPPFFPLLFAGWKFVIGNNLILFKIWPIIFDSLSAFLIFLILKKRGVIWPAMGTAFYLFSFTVLSTSSYVTGGEVMVFFMLLAFFFDENEKSFFSGISWALACLSKLYAAPILIGFLIYKIVKKDFKGLKKIIQGGILATLIIIGPFLLFASKEMLDNLVLHQFSRPAGLNKIEVLLFFGKYEWLLLVSAIAGLLFNIKKDLLLPLFFSILFFLWYPDLYYLYLHPIIPLFIIITIELIDGLHRRIFNDIALAYILLYIMLSIYPISYYANVISHQDVFENPREIGVILQGAPETYPVFGVQEVAPLLALISGKPIFNNIIDSNTQSFASGAQSRNEISKQAVKNGIYLVSRVAEYPDLGIKDFGYEGYFDPVIFRSSCTLYKSFDRELKFEQLNKINIYSCYNPNI